MHTSSSLWEMTESDQCYFILYFQNDIDLPEPRESNKQFCHAAYLSSLQFVMLRYRTLRAGQRVISTSCFSEKSKTTTQTHMDNTKVSYLVGRKNLEHHFSVLYYSFTVLTIVHYITLELCSVHAVNLFTYLWPCSNEKCSGPYINVVKMEFAAHLGSHLQRGCIDCSRLPFCQAKVSQNSVPL